MIPLPAEPAPSLISDDAGAILMGWLDERVLYARFEGVVSVRLARAHAARFEVLTAGSSAIAYFSDGSALTHYDLLVRSSFARFVLAHPRLFRSITLLSTKKEVTKVASPLTKTFSDVVRLTSNTDDFRDRILVDAPVALSTPTFEVDAAMRRGTWARRR